MLVLPLNDGHDRKGFDCGDDDLNRSFSQIARQLKEKGVSSTFVAVADGASMDVLGFYAISLAELVNIDLPTQYRKRLPEKVPVFRLGRLAIAQRHHGKRIGEFMLFDAIDRITRIAKEVVASDSWLMQSLPPLASINNTASNRCRITCAICSCRFKPTRPAIRECLGFPR